MIMVTLPQIHCSLGKCSNCFSIELSFSRALDIFSKSNVNEGNDSNWEHLEFPIWFFGLFSMKSSRHPEAIQIVLGPKIGLSQLERYFMFHKIHRFWWYWNGQVFLEFLFLQILLLIFHPFLFVSMPLPVSCFCARSYKPYRTNPLPIILLSHNHS